MTSTTAPARAAATRLIVTVDTEEEGLWSGGFDAARATVENVARVPRFQAICDELGIRPTYLVDSPVATSAAASGLLREIADSGRCEIGTHIHPWNTPPEVGRYDSHASYLCNLPLELQREKLRVVTEQVGDAFGARPLAFRAGRCGLDGAGAALVRDLGYRVDSSVCPLRDYSGDGGPDFRAAPFEPYWIGDDLLQEGPPGGLLEVPIAVGFNRSDFRLASRAYALLRRRPLRALRASGIADRTGLLRQIKFSPEKGDAQRLMTLARVFAARRAPSLVMTLHSSSLLPGCSPYVTSEQGLTRFLATFGEVARYCLSELGMRPATLTEFAIAYTGRGAGSL